MSFLCSFTFSGPNHNKFDSELAKRSIENTQWPGRYEIISRKNSVYVLPVEWFNDFLRWYRARFYLDGAHTEDSMQVCSDWFISKTDQDNRKRVLIFNVIGQRDPGKLLRKLLKCDFDIAIFTTNNFDDAYLKSPVNRNTAGKLTQIINGPYSWNKNFSQTIRIPSTQLLTTKNVAAKMQKCGKIWTLALRSTYLRVFPKLSSF